MYFFRPIAKGLTQFSIGLSKSCDNSMDDAAQGIKALSHIRRIRVGVKRIGIAECEHRLIKNHQ